MDYNFTSLFEYLFRTLSWNVSVRQDMSHHHPATGSLPSLILFQAILPLLLTFKQDHQFHPWFLIKHQVLSHLLVHLCVSFNPLPLLPPEVDLLKMSILPSKALLPNQKTQEKVCFPAVVPIYLPQTKSQNQTINFHLNYPFLLNKIKIQSSL